LSENIKALISNIIKYATTENMTTITWNRWKNGRKKTERMQRDWIKIRCL